MARTNLSKGLIRDFKENGRPNIYTPQELHEKANEYFNICLGDKIDKGIGGKIHMPFTISGLNLFLGVSKNYLSEKAKDKKFLGTVEYIRNFIETDVESKALAGAYSPAASSFNLKNNFGWTEKQEIIQTNIGVSDESALKKLNSL